MAKGATLANLLVYMVDYGKLTI